MNASVIAIIDGITRHIPRRQWQVLVSAVDYMLNSSLGDDPMDIFEGVGTPQDVAALGGILGALRVPDSPPEDLQTRLQPVKPRDGHGSNVVVVLDGQVIEIPNPQWRVFMYAVNWIVDSGDMYAILSEKYSHAEMDAARECSGDLYLARV